MKLEPCPFCKSVRLIHYDRYGGYVLCETCKATGPENDPDARHWNAFSRAVHGLTPIESIEVGPMPWRLQIAARFWAHNGVAEVPDTKHDEVAEWFLSAADSLIAAHKATEEQK